MVEKVCVQTDMFNQVTIKMDVCYTHHSYIIGKKGVSIRPVAEETRCGIYFPSSNKSWVTRKSNQVKIIGSIRGAERARGHIRKLVPLIFRFELPTAVNPEIINLNTPYVNQLQQKYDVQVTLRTLPQYQRMFVKVQGLECKTQELKQAMCLLMKYLCGKLSNQIRVQMVMEIQTYHFAKVAGKNHANLESIIANTQTEISLLDGWNHYKPNYKQTVLVISGNIDNVYLASQQLTGSLPLEVTFNLPHRLGNKWNRNQLATIESELDVNIDINYPAKNHCVIRGIERYAGKIYEARKRVLGINGPSIVANIPLSYFIPITGITSQVILAMNAQASPLIPSPRWIDFKQADPSAIMVQQSQSQYNINLHNSPATSGYSLLREFSSSVASVTCSQEESTSATKCPSAIPSSSYQTIPCKHFTLSGIPEMQYKEEEEDRLPKNPGSEIGVSTSVGALQISDQKEEDQASKNLNTSNNSESTPVSVENQFTAGVLTDLPSTLTSVGLEKYNGLFIFYEIDLTIFLSLDDFELCELGISDFCDRHKINLLISEMNKSPSPVSAVP